MSEVFRILVLDSGRVREQRSGRTSLELLVQMLLPSVHPDGGAKVPVRQEDERNLQKPDHFFPKSRNFCNWQNVQREDLGVVVVRLPAFDIDESSLYTAEL